MASRARLAGLLRNTIATLVPSQSTHAARVGVPAVYVTSRGMASSKLFVGGLAFATDDRSLRDAFSVHGEVMDAKVILDRETGRSRGFGFVTFFSEGEAETALQKMDGQPLNGRIIRVNYAINKPREGMGGGFQRGFNQGYGQGDDGLMNSSFGRGPSGYGQGGPSGYGQDGSIGGAGLSSFGSGFSESAAGGDSTQGTKGDRWLDDPVDTASKPASPKKSLYDDPSWDDILKDKGPTNASTQQSSLRKDDGWNDIFGKSSASTSRAPASSSGGFSSGSAKKDDWDFGLGNLDDIGKKPSSSKMGNLDDLNLDNWDDIMGTKSALSKPISSKSTLDSDLDIESDSTLSERQANSR